MESSSAPSPGFSGFSCFQKFLFYLCGIPSVLVIVLSAYIGLILYFFVALLVVSTLLLSLFSYSLGSWSDLTMHILIWITWTPFFELLLSLCLESLTSFFFHVREFISLNSLARYLETRLALPNAPPNVIMGFDVNQRWFVLTRLFLLALLMVLCRASSRATASFFTSGAATARFLRFRRFCG
jgi:hypothetical protein